MKQYFLIMNPGSRSGKSKTLFSTIHRFFRENNLLYDYAETSSLDDAENFSESACRDGYKTVVAVGGDGTINRALNGLYDKGKRTSLTRFGVIYTGTSPDFCKSFNIPVDVSGSLCVIKNGYETEIMPGMIRYAKKPEAAYSAKAVDDSEYFRDSVFACCANIGLGADLAEAANSGIRGVIGDFLGTFISLLKTLVTFSPKCVSMVVDGSEKRIETLYNLSIGKTFYIASGIKVKNELSFADKRLYLLAVKDLSIAKTPLCLKSIYSGNDLPNSDIFDFSYCKNVEIMGDGGFGRIEFDGDPAGYLPCRIGTVSDSLRLITGENRAF